MFLSSRLLRILEQPMQGLLNTLLLLLFCASLTILGGIVTINAMSC